MNDFKKFILRGNVVDLAVAVVVGAAFGAIVAALVADFVTPLIAAIGGKPDFSTLIFTVNGSAFKYGDFINKLISFVLIASVVYFFIVRPLNILMSHLNPKDDVDVPAERECPHCLSAIPAAANRCKFCTSVVKPVPQKAAKKA
ncbi:MAG TPA: large conductance mechanosensitive channel protein MscL [Candidatus Saccharimonadales bacterium]|nr:large conductance mechanosensitive channel protein MscL [Candidatus Saccharimonadales bacterium]